MSPITERAKYLSRMVHVNEIRRDGQPYYVHPENMVEMSKDKSDNIICAIYLHDTIENASNPKVIEFLIHEYFPQEVINLVEALTHDKDISYMEYIKNICKNTTALYIKFLDMIDNTNDINKPNYPDSQKKKYYHACQYMVNIGIDVPKILRERLGV